MHRERSAVSQWLFIVFSFVFLANKRALSTTTSFITNLDYYQLSNLPLVIFARAFRQFFSVFSLYSVSPLKVTKAVGLPTD